MKKIQKHFSILLLTMLISVLSVNTSYAQDAPADPSLSGTNGTTTGVVGGAQNGGANIDGGMNIFLLFALAYGTHRYYRAKRKEKELAGGATE
jgi:hypothetical protein